MSYHIDPNNLQIPSFGDPHLSAAGDQHHFISDHLNSHPSTSAAAADSVPKPPTWLNSAILRQQAAAASTGSFLHLQTNSDEVNVSGESMMASAAAAAGDGGEVTWQSERQKAEILAHPLYEQLLSAHVACLRIATPVDQLPRIDAQLAQSQHVVAKYSVLGNHHQINAGDDKELDQFMVRV